jgi:hypothetical protein
MDTIPEEMIYFKKKNQPTIIELFSSLKTVRGSSAGVKLICKKLLVIFWDVC